MLIKYKFIARCTNSQGFFVKVYTSAVRWKHDLAAGTRITCLGKQVRLVGYLEFVITIL